MAALVGKWEYVSADNLDQYMEVTGVPETLREIARKNHPYMEISKDGNKWVLKTTVSDKVRNTTFTVGEEFDSLSLTGQALKCIVAMEGDKMIETQKCGNITVVVIREVVDGQLVSKMTVAGVTATLVFKKA